jgi:hypothetical protein
MSEESVVVDGRRSRAEIARLAGLYGASGMGQREFCSRHGMALSTLNRHLKKQQQRQDHAGSEGAGRSRLVAVELVAEVTSTTDSENRGGLTVLLSSGRRVEVGRGFDAATLAQLVTVLERL